MKLIGHPLIDIGLAVASLKTGKKSVSDLSEKDLQDAGKWFLHNIENFEKMHIFSSFWMNNPLMGKNLSSRDKYLFELASIVNSSSDKTNMPCQTCGNDKSFTSLSRSWFPLGGSETADPFTYPNLKGKHLCLICCRAALLSTLGCKFIAGNPYLIHLNDPELIMRPVKIAFDAVNAGMTSGNANIYDTPESSRKLGLFEVLALSPLWNPSMPGFLNKIPKDGATVIHFSNKGTKIYFSELLLPANILIFFTSVNTAGINNTLIEIIQWSGKSDKEPSFLYYVENQRSIASLLFNKLDKKQNELLNTRERLLMKIYEHTAIGKAERFDVLEGLAKRIRQMDKKDFDSFTKQLANISKKESLLDLLTKYSKSSSTDLKISQRELKIIYLEPPAEVSKILYLLCLSEDN